MKYKSDIKIYDNAIYLDKRTAKFFKDMGATYLKYWYGDIKGKYRLYGKPKREKSFYKIQKGGRRVSAGTLMGWLKKDKLYNKNLSITVETGGDVGNEYIDLSFTVVNDTMETGNEYIDLSFMMKEVKDIGITYLCEIPSYDKKEILFKNITIKDATMDSRYKKLKKVKSLDVVGNDVKIIHEVVSKNTVQVKASEFTATIESWVKRGIHWEMKGVK